MRCSERESSSFNGRVFPPLQTELLLGRMLTKIDNSALKEMFSRKKARPPEGPSIGRPAMVMRWYQDDPENPPWLKGIGGGA